ncbi:MAG: MOP flippase family protein [Candidatus Firestonebacteria bacterium]
MNEELKDQMAKGLKWSGISQISRYILQFIFSIFLARKLFPEDFGIISIVLTFVNLIGIFNDLGLRFAIVQKKELKDSHLTSSFWICILISAVFFVIIIFSAPLIALFFHKEMITPIIRIFAIKIIVDSFSIVPDTLLRRNMAFKKLAFIDLGETIAYGITAIILVLNGFGIFSIAWGYAISSFVKAILLWKNHPIPIKIQFDITSFRELFMFSKSVMGFKIVSYFISNIDYLIVGKFLGMTPLGYYTLAFNMANFPREKLSSIVSNVTFPAFSKIQDDYEVLRQGYLKTITYISIVTFPLLAGLLVLASLFITTVYTQKWNEMILPLQILCIGGMFSSITTFIGVIFWSTGHSDYSFKFSLIALVGIFLILLYAAQYGIIGIAIGVSIYSILINIVGEKMVESIIKSKFLDYLRALLPATISSAIMVLGLIIFLKLVGFVFLLPPSILLVSSILCGTLIYFFSLYLINSNIFKSLIAISRRMI